MKEKTRTILYGTFVTLMVLFLYIAYANVVTELKIEGEGEAKEQEGVYIANVEYLTNNGADTTSSEINYYIGTMLDSKIVLGSSTSSSITYQVTIKNNTDREQVFIGIIKDETNEEAYNNTNIQPNVETAGGVTGIEAGKTVIAPGEYITFPVTYAYARTDTSNNELQGKINFRFRELPILDLSNEGETYTLEDVSSGYEKEIEFTVSNYNENYTNGVPLTYVIEPEFTEGCPLTATIYDSEGNELTESITIAGDNNTHEDHTYTLKLTWDSSITGEEYLGQEYTCKVAVKAIPDNAEDLGYGDYVLEKSFDINITTRSVIADGSWDGTVNTPILTADMQPVAWDEEGNEFTPKTNEEWYDYVDQASGVDGTSNWANAKTSDGSYWVWIPRYEYKIDASNVTSTSDAGTIDVNFIPVSTNITTEGYTTTTDVNQTVNGVEVLSKGITVSSEGYIIHPAFTSDVDVGGWDSELPGIWVAKYEMSMETNGVATETSDETIGNVAISDTVKMVSKPGVPSWRYINISNCYENSLAYDTSKNSHLMKNSEWGAVAYLTHSKYGRNGTEVTINSNSSYYTAGGSGATATTNVVQSSTGNATGIYDLSGCAYEYVAAFNDAYSSTGTYFTGTNYLSASGSNMGAIGLSNGGSTKYLTAYSNGTAQYYIGSTSGNAYTTFAAMTSAGYTVSITGDAISEVWVSTYYGWFSDYSHFVYSSWPFARRGGYYNGGSGAGVFWSSFGIGGRYSSYSFRVCLAHQTLQENCTHTYSDWVTVKGACVEDGQQKRICSKCGHTEFETITATGTHVYGDWETVTEATCSEQGTEKRTCTACGYEETQTTDYSRTHNFENETCTICGLNYPQMTSDMTAVAWDSSGNEFTPTTDEEWFDYWGHQDGDAGESNWANAKTSDGSYWVWIPRYEYKIDASNVTSTSDAGTIDVRFIPTTTNSTTSGYTTTTDVNQTVNGVEVLSKGITVSSDGYIIHPAFTSTPSIGGWDSELAGIWVAKYEMSMETSGVATTTSSATIGNVATSSTIKAVSKPGVTSWGYINISNCYENSLAYDTSKNSHLMKNSEWGAVAYLTHSKYGRNGTEVTINNNSSYYTAGGSGATATTNVAQSSTGNATGIYDLSGCAYEFVAAFNDAYSSSESWYSTTNSNFASASNTNMGAIGLANGESTKYLTAYSNGTDQYYIGQSSGNAYTSHTAFAAGGYTVSITGDAISEVWVSSYFGWFGGYSRFACSSNPFFFRGCSSDDYDLLEYDGSVGVFASDRAIGLATGGCSFRVCLADPQDLITFYINDTAYTAIEGMTWEEFANSGWNVLDVLLFVDDYDAVTVSCRGCGAGVSLMAPLDWGGYREIIGSEYVAPDANYWYESDHDFSQCGWISFYVFGTEYSCPEGCTWGDFIDNIYPSEGTSPWAGDIFYDDETGQVYVGDYALLTITGDYVYTSDLIIEEMEYYEGD